MNVNDRTLQANSARVFIAQQYEGELLDYTINYAPLLGTDVINASTWSGAGLNVTDESFVDTETHCKISGTRGNYLLTNTIVTVGGQTLVRNVRMHITAENAAVVNGDY